MPAVPDYDGQPAADRPAERRRRRIGQSVRITISLALVVAIVLTVDLGAVGRLVGAADLSLAALALLAALADRVVMFGKWYPLIRTQVDVPFFLAARIYYASTFSAVFLPSMSGDVLRGLALGRGNGTTAEAAASIVMERLLGMIGGGVMALVAIGVAVQNQIDLGVMLPWAAVTIAAPLGLVLAPFVPAAFPGLSKRFRSLRGLAASRFVSRFGAAYGRYRHYPRMLTVVGLLSVVEQLFPIVVLGILSYALGTSITVEMLIVAVPLTLFASRLPFSVWGLGITEGALVYLLGLFGVPAAEAVALGLAVRVVDLIALSPGAFLWTDLVRPARTQSANRSAS